MKLLKTLISVGVISVMATTGVVSSLKSTSAFAFEQTTLGFDTPVSDYSSLQLTDRMLISVAPNWQAKVPKVKDAISGEVAAHLKKFAQGNDGDAWVEALEIRGSKLYLRAKIRHRQITKLPFGKKVTTYSLHNTVETSYDPLNPASTVDKSRLCFSKASVIGGGKACVSGGDIVGIINPYL